MKNGDTVRITSGPCAGELGEIVSDMMLRDLGGVTVRAKHPTHGVLLMWHLTSQLKNSADCSLSLADELEMLLEGKF